MAKSFYVKDIVSAPYICTVPSGGVHAIKCYPDAITIFVNGQKIGYSRKAHTMIIPIGSSGSEIKTYRTEVLKFLTAIDKRRAEQTGKVVLCAVSKEKQNKK